MMCELGAVLEFRRPFYWGVALIGDPEAIGVPDLGPEQSIGSSAAVVVVPVRHAQDSGMADEDGDGVAPFEVSIRCSSEVAEVQDLQFDGTVSLPSGQLSFGDADAETIVPLPPGDYRLQITIVPVDHAERVHVWYSPATLACRTDTRVARVGHPDSQFQAIRPSF